MTFAECKSSSGKGGTGNASARTGNAERGATSYECIQGGRLTGGRGAMGVEPAGEERWEVEPAGEERWEVEPAGEIMIFVGRRT